MPTVHDIAAVMDEMAPWALTEEWDNTGILVDCGGEIESVLVALDITDDVVNEAEAEGCQLILSHHPVIFQPMRSIRRGDVVFRMVKKGISAICAHTNLDIAAGGVNDILAAVYGLVEPQLFAGIGRVGQLKTPASAAALASFFAKKFSAHVRLADAGKPVSTLAVLGGSGGGLLKEALDAGADCILTGEADHHDALDAVHAGVSVVVVGHYASEFPVVPVLANRLAKQMPGLKVQVTKRGKDPFVYLP